MAENPIREIHTQLDLITNDLAALPREDRIAWFRRTTQCTAVEFSQRDQRHNLCSKSVF